MKLGPLGIEVIMLGVGVGFWLASVNLMNKNAKLGRTFQTIATWIFLITIAYKAYTMFA